MDDPLDGRIGEAWSGEVPDGSHINVVLARRGSPTAAAAVGALASPRPGHLPFLACLAPGVVVRPSTIVVNKSPIEGDGPIGPLTWGAAQLGIAQGVLDAVDEGLLDPAEASEVVVLVAVWVDPGGRRRDGGQGGQPRGDARRDRRRLQPPDADAVRALTARREDAANAYYNGA